MNTEPFLLFLTIIALVVAISVWFITYEWGQVLIAFSVILVPFLGVHWYATRTR